MFATPVRNHTEPGLRVMCSEGNSTYIAPHPLLAPYIAHYTVTQPYRKADSSELTLIPDISGCIVCTWDGSSLHNLFWGATTKTVTVKNDSGDISLRFFAEFLPGGAQHLTGLPQTETADMCIPFELLDARLDSSVRDIFERSRSIGELVAYFDRFFINCLDRYSQQDIVPALYAYLYKKHGVLSAKDLAEHSGYSLRHLNRLFCHSIGMNVKTCSRLLRVNRALLDMQRTPKPLTVIAQDAGYYDQSHFIHDFKTVCSVTPTEYLRSMSVFYNEQFKF